MDWQPKRRLTIEIGVAKHFQLVDFFGTGDVGKSSIGPAFACGFQCDDVWNNDRKLCKYIIESINKL